MQATEGSDKFGTANAAARVQNTSEAETKNGVDELGMKALEVYFGNLVAAVINDKSVLKQLVTNNAKLAATNEDLVAIVKKFQRNQESRKENIPPQENRRTRK